MVMFSYYIPGVCGSAIAVRRMFGQQIDKSQVISPLLFTGNDCVNILNAPVPLSEVRNYL